MSLKMRQAITSANNDPSHDTSINTPAPMENVHVQVHREKTKQQQQQK